MAAITITESQAEELLIEIITGKKLFMLDNGGMMAVRFPSMEERDTGRIVYLKNFNELKKSGVPSIEEMRQRIVKFNLLPGMFYSRIENMKMEIECLSKACETTTSTMQRLQLKSEMDEISVKISELEMKERSIICNTAEIQAESAKIDYFVSKCTLYGEELCTPRWKSYEEFCADTDVKIVSVSRYNFITLMAGISLGVIRAVARTQEWRNRWKSLKGSSVFSGPSAEWDRNKVALCYWSDFYDSIYGHPTPPPDDIINDDSRLFDWIRDVNRMNAMRAGKAPSGAKEGVSKKVGAPYKVRPGKRPAPSIAKKV